MAGQAPERKYFPIPFGGVLDEQQTPARVGGSNLTACQNLNYRRLGSWGKRGGSAQAFYATAQGGEALTPVNGIRWYTQGYTQLIIYAQGALYVGGDYTGVPSGLAKLADVGTGTAITFAAVYDPAYNIGTGQDLLAFAGAGGAAFANGWIAFVQTGTTISGTVKITVQNPPAGAVSTTVYTILPTDNVVSLAQQMVTLLNETTAVTAILGAAAPFMGQAVATSFVDDMGRQVGVVAMGALASGSAGTNITFEPTATGSGYSVSLSGASPTSNLITANTVGGMAAWDGGLYGVVGLGWQIQQMAALMQTGVTQAGVTDAPRFEPTGCVAWHDHLWMWGDPGSPGTVWATDIGTVEDVSFMIQNGGYPVGEGDGDPFVITCVPIGNALYVFKRQSIWVITGYDFQAGEYTFQLEPIVQGYGIPSQYCVTVLNNALIFWNGSGFYRLAVGAYEPEYIGAPIPLTSGKVTHGNPGLMRACAGSFVEATALNGNFAPAISGGGTVIHSNLALFACDIGNGVADTIVGFDDDATQAYGAYAWFVWTGWTVGAWVPFGSGENNAQTGQDEPSLYWIPDPSTFPPVPSLPYGYPIVNKYGAVGQVGDSGVPISWFAQTGWEALQTPALLKELHRLFLEIEAISGVNISVAFRGYNPLSTSNDVQTQTYPTTVAPTDAEAYQTPYVRLEPWMRSHAYMLTFAESSTNGAFEISQAVADYTEEAFRS